MIENIRISNVATYGETSEELANLKKINFVYGSNGTGKTTISRVISDGDSYPGCSLDWRGGTPVDPFVYNRDFVERNFNQPNELKGIFTLGEKDKETLDKIAAAKRDLDQIDTNVISLNATLNGEDGDGGKVADLEVLEAEFETNCWVLKQKHDEKLQGAFTGFRGNKRKFKEKLLEESVSNSSSFVPLADLEKKAETVFGDMPQVASMLTVPNGDNILAHESNNVLKKKVIGKKDVDIAALIETLGNSDWVKKGREFYNPEERVCPFCQQNTPPTLEDSLNEYFDETFIADTMAIDKLHSNYKTDSEQLQQSVQILINSQSKFLDTENLKIEGERLDLIFRINLQRIEEKRREPSKSIELEPTKKILDAMKNLVDVANTAIQQYNTSIANIETERKELTGQVWRYLLDHEIKTELVKFKKDKTDIDRAIANLKTQIKEKTEKQQRKEQDIRSLEKDTTSIKPTINGINVLLQSFGFTGFSLAQSHQEQFYKIQRPDGSDAKETLSEGEKNFVSFLYFYHLIKGSETESGMTSDRIVVFDDPVSSLDSDILFIVSSLIKDLFDDVRNGSGTIKQIFVLTHNVYFHKEVSFNSQRDAGKKLKEETFWIVRKVNKESRIQCYGTNPIKTSYALLWNEIRNRNGDNLTIQNTLRRILEYYFNILGNVNPDKICEKFPGQDKLICKTLFAWVNDGSHSALDSLYISIDDSTVDNHLRVFKEIFEKTGHIAHYNMMTGEDTAETETIGT